MTELVEGTKYDDAKPRFDLISPVYLEGTAEVLRYGAVKYEPNNWLKGIVFSRVYRALLGHLNAWQEGEEIDQESGCHHLFHASCCLMFLCHYTHYEQYDAFDDRPDYATLGSTTNNV
jgi:hypothetical protein